MRSFRFESRKLMSAGLRAGLLGGVLVTTVMVVSLSASRPIAERFGCEASAIGRFLGEMGLYRSSVRSASVIAERPSIVHVLTREIFERVERDDPVLAAAFHAQSSGRSPTASSSKARWWLRFSAEALKTE